MPSPSNGASVPVRPLAAVVVVGCLATEIGWRLHFGLGSPALGIVYALIAVLIGHAAHRVVVGERTEPSTGEAFVAGSVVLAWLYLALLRFSGTSLFAIVAAVLAAASMWAYPLKGVFTRRVPLSSVLVQAIVVFLAIRNAAYVDHLKLDQPTPRIFGWVDTSFWLNNAYGLERGWPVRDILVSGGTLNYHYGASLVVVGIRRLTGLPMHVAEVTALALCAWALAAVLGRAAVRLVGAKEGGLTAICAPLVAVAWEQKILFNYPSAYAAPLAVFALLRLRATRGPRSALLLVPTMALLMMTKEVTFLYTAVLGGVIALAAFLATRSWIRGAVLAASGIVAKVAYGILVEHGQKARFTIFRGHFSREWFSSIFQEGYGINSPLAGSPAFHHSLAWGLLVAVAMGIWAWRSRRTVRGWVLASGVLVYAVGFAILIVLEPHHVPEYDPPHAAWVMGDMFQFLLNAEDILLVTGGLVALSTIDAALPSPIPAPVIAVSVASLGYYGATHTFTAPDPGGTDPAVEAMAHIDVAGTVTAASLPAIAWYPFGEHPDLAGYFGHQFYLLRHGRWATAHPRLAEMEKSQTLLFTTSNAAEAREVARKEGITHVLAPRASIPPWLHDTTPLFENDRWVVFDLRTPP